LKKLNGAAFTRPAADSVVTSAIGRGTIVADSSLYCWARKKVGDLYLH
jgi:hypothetical protein